MSLDLISATCYPDNARSRRVLEKCGFAYEGRLHRAELLWNGEVRDHLLFICRTKPCRQMQNKTYIFLRNVL